MTWVNRAKRILRAPLRWAGDYKPAEERVLSDRDPQLIVSKKYGFLPRELPLWDIPAEFRVLDQILNRMPCWLPDGSRGLLWEGRLGDVVLNELPMLDVTKVENTRLQEALIRDYTHLASGYLLEPTDIAFRKTGVHGLGRDRLPANIAVPLAQLAAKIGVRPFLEYTQYILNNWRLKDPTQGMHPENLELFRRLEGGPDEGWFMKIHLFMTAESGHLISNTYDILRAVENNDRPAFDRALQRQLENSKVINLCSNRMWEGSQPKKSNEYRAFLIGTNNAQVFPNGVVYEGVSDEPTFYRGATGANDSIVPTLDNLFEVTANMPSNSLTEILKDFRSYRPREHQEFIAWIEAKAKEVGVRRFAEADPNSTVLYLANLDQIGEWRERHWRFTKEYNIKVSKNPTSTGGAPIITWLPNQLAVVLKIIEEVGQGVQEDRLSFANKSLRKELVRRATAMGRILKREVEEMKAMFPSHKH